MNTAQKQEEEKVSLEARQKIEREADETRLQKESDDAKKTRTEEADKKS